MDDTIINPIEINIIEKNDDSKIISESIQKMESGKSINDDWVDLLGEVKDELGVKDE